MKNKDSLNFYAMAGVCIFASFFAPYTWTLLYGWTCGLLACASVVFFLKNRKRLTLSGIDLYLVLCFVCLCAGLVNLENSSIGMPFFLTCILPVPFLYFFSRNYSRRMKMRPFLWCIWGCGVIVGLYGLIEMMFHIGFIQEHFFGEIFSRVFLGNRLMSFQVHPAVAATFFLAVLPVSASLVILEKGKTAGRWARGGIIVAILSVLMTFSRGAFFALIVCTCVYCFLINKRKMAVVCIAVFLSAALIILFCSVSSGVCGPFSRFSFRNISSEANLQRKIDRAVVALRMAADHPFTGTGYQGFYTKFGNYSQGLFSGEQINSPEKVADCMFLTLAAETGVIGTAGFILFIIALFCRAAYALNMLNDYNRRIILSGFISGLLGILCMFLTYDVLYWASPCIFFWTYCGIVSALSVKADPING